MHPASATTTLADLAIEELLSSIGEPFFALDGDLRLTFMNQAAADLLGCRPEDVVGRMAWDAFPESRGSVFHQQYTLALAERRAVAFTAYFPRTASWFQVKAAPNRAGLAVFFHDVTNLKSAQKRASRLAGLQASLRQVATTVAADAPPQTVFEQVVSEAAQGVDADACWIVRFTGAGYRVLAGRTRDGAVTPPAEELEVLEGSEVEQVRRTGEAVVVRDDAGGRFAAQGLRAGAVVPVRLAGRVWGALGVGWRAPREDDDMAVWLGDLCELVAVAVANAAAREELSRQARTDALTGLANLRLLQERLDEQIGRARRHWLPLTLAIVDVDHFKTINDGFGHDAGDRVLAMVAEELRRACRQEDLAARIGGDEFALVLDGTDAGAALAMVERVRAAVRARRLDGLPPVTLSIGLSEWEPGLSREAVQRRADDALYWAKLHGRDAAWAYDAEVMEDLERDRQAHRLRRGGEVLDAIGVQERVRDAKIFWRSTLDALSKHVAVLDERGEIIAVNAGWRRFAEENGGGPGTGVGSDYLAVCDAADDPHGAAVAAGLREVLDGTRASFELEYPCHAPDQERWFVMRADRFAGDRPRRVVVHHEDVTERRRAQAAIAFQAQQLQKLPVAVVTTDLDLRVTDWNRAAETLYGWTAAEAIGRRTDELTHVEIHGWMRDGLEQFKTAGAFEGEHMARDRHGREFPIQVRSVVLSGADGEPVGLVTMSMDITDRHAHERSLKAARDHLRTVTSSIGDGLLVLDGDDVIVEANEAAMRLLGCDRLFGRRAAPALYGSPDARAEALLADGRDEDDAFVRADGTRLPVSWTSAPLHGGGGRVIVFRDATERRAQAERLRREAEGLRWADRIRKALDGGLFVLFAQPILDLRTGRMDHHELLIRLRDGAGGFIPPAEFLPAAEEHGLMSGIDAWVAEQAVEHAAGGRAVHFNVSSQSVGDASVLTALERELRNTGADPSLLTVELTETAMTRNAEETAAFGDRVHALGCRLALDDFGTGYNGLARLKDLPIDTLKIDRHFINDLLDHGGSESVVKAVVGLARDLGVPTVAEGVEDAATLARLVALGIDHAQGYFIGWPTEIAPPAPPVPAFRASAAPAVLGS